MKVKKAKAKTDIISSGKDKKVYCRRDDILDVISDHGDVLIVSFKDQKFPARTDELCLMPES